jgi:hypothetical protein
MKIHNAAEFFQFLRYSRFINIHPEIASFVRCMEEYGRMCSCEPHVAKLAKVNQCKMLYVNFLSRLPQFKDLLLSATTDNVIEFYSDNQSLLTLTR